MNERSDPPPILGSDHTDPDTIDFVRAMDLADEQIRAAVLFQPLAPEENGHLTRTAAATQADIFEKILLGRLMVEIARRQRRSRDG